MPKNCLNLKFRIASILLCLLLALPALGDTSSKEIENYRKRQSYADCNWLVTYRGRTYDLMPLTKQSLLRPIDDDIREIMSRYPESKQHLDLMSKYTHDAKVHTWIASGALAGAAITSIFRSKAKNDYDRKINSVISLSFILFFLKGAEQSWRSTDAAKSELTEAVNAFNLVSPHPIEPAGAAHDNL